MRKEGSWTGSVGRRVFVVFAALATWGTGLLWSPAYAAVESAALLAQVRAYNAAVAAAASKHAGRVVLVDLFTGSAELTSQITVSADGLHPSDAGYALIAERFADAMRKSGVPLRAAP